MILIHTPKSITGLENKDGPGPAWRMLGTEDWFVTKFDHLNTFLSLVNEKIKAIKKYVCERQLLSVLARFALLGVNSAYTDSRVSDTREPPEWAKNIQTYVKISLLASNFNND